MRVHVDLYRVVLALVLLVLIACCVVFCQQLVLGSLRVHGVVSHVQVLALIQNFQFFLLLPFRISLLGMGIRGCVGVAV